jgi:AraC family transcriptional regulator, regulatory protein of adaptative response / methylated-DNA-[protein]-cysteine methyltransferase
LRVTPSSTAASSSVSGPLGSIADASARCGNPFAAISKFYPSATAAELAGYRPCLRCRPETAPFSPAWKGSAAIVERAARLIRDEGALDARGATVETLAARVGVGGRHLTRLFQKHLGASPIQVAKTARVQRAKRLLTGTDLAITEIALQAGFGSVRRFNAVFQEVYRRPPNAIKRRISSIPS